MVGERSEVDEHGPVRKVVGHGPRERERETGLPASSGPRQGQETSILGHEPSQLVELPVPPDQAIRRDGQLRQGRLGACGQHGVVAEDRPFQLTKLRAGLQAELLLEQPAPVAVDVQRVCLLSVPVERQHELRPKPLAKRVGREQGTQLGESQLVPTDRDVRGQLLLLRDESELLQAQGVVPREALVGDVRERGATPQGKRSSEERGCKWRVPGGQRRAAFLEQALEPRRVELSVQYPEHVAGRHGVDPRLGQELAQLRDVDMDQPVGARRRTAGPQGVHEEIGGDDLVRAQQQRREQRSTLRRTELHGTAVGDHLDRAENAESHAGRSLRLNRS